MEFEIRLSNEAKRDLKKLHPLIQHKIITFLQEQIKRLDNPRMIGKNLRGKLKNYWRYRVGDYRIICEIRDNEILIVVINIGHRKDVYK